MTSRVTSLSLDSVSSWFPEGDVTPERGGSRRTGLKASLISSGVGSSVCFDQIRDVRHFSEVPQTPSETDSNLEPQEEVRGSELTFSSDVLPALFFPACYPKFYPSDTEDSFDTTEKNPVCRSIPGSVKGFFRCGHRSSRQESDPVSKHNSDLNASSSSVSF
ncbi:MARVEL domain-containing protein 2-like [Arapaima gigas]